MDWSFFILGAIAGGFINGFAGFGTALFALGLWLQFLSPIQAVSIVLVISVVTGLQGLWLVRSSIAANPKRLARFLFPGVIGIPVGVAALASIEPRTLKIVVACFLILYGAYFTGRRNLPRLSHPTPVVDGVVGFFGGILGGAASLSGALPTMWLSLRDWPKAETRAVLQPYNVTLLGLTATILAIQGAYNFQTLYLLAIALPIALLASQVGIALFRRIDDAMFRRVLIGLTLVSGITILLREMF